MGRLDTETPRTWEQSPQENPPKNRLTLIFNNQQQESLSNAKGQNVDLNLAQKAVVPNASSFRSGSHSVCLEEKNWEYCYCFLRGSKNITFPKPAMTQSSILLLLVDEIAHQQNNDQLSYGFWFLTFYTLSILFSKSCSQAWPLPMVKDTVWKCQKQLCVIPVLKWCLCSTSTASATHAHWAAGMLGDAENLLLLLELSHRSSRTVTATLTGQCAVAQLLPVSWPAAHAALGRCSCGSKNLLSNPPFAIPQKEASLSCGCSILLKNKCTAGKVHTQTCTFFSQPGTMDNLFGFVWKELGDQNDEVQLACTY